MTRPALFGADAPLCRLGFRPFHMLAAGFGALAVPAWLAAYTGAWPGTRFDLAWHAHEMVFGVAAAVVAGFQLTAVRNWTGLPTPDGAALRAFALLWIAGRAGALGPAPLFALVDGAFLFVLAGVVLRPLLRAADRRNLPIAGVVLLLGLCNAACHAVRPGWLALPPLAPVHSALLLALLLALLIAVVAGRVAPMFTRNGAPDSHPRQYATLDLASLVALLLAQACWLAGATGVLVAGAAWTAAALHAARWVLWDPLATSRHPLLWSFHLSYALLVAGIAAPFLTRPRADGRPGCPESAP